MSRFQLDLALPEDDAALRRVLARTPMDGRISLSFHREPSFFDATVVDGHFRQIMVGRDRAADDTIVGLGSRSIRRVYVNGAPTSVGYLSLLRVLPEYRAQGRLLARAYQYFHKLHADGRAPIYLTTIAEGNQRALEALIPGRAGLPAYHFAGRLMTAAIPLARRRRTTQTQCSSLSIRSASAMDLDDLLEFFQRHGPARQFFPIYEKRDFIDEKGLLRGLRPEDILVARRDSQIIGTLAAWDQHGFRQTMVHSYARGMQWARPFYNGWAGLRGMPRLPAPGSPMRYLTGALPVVAADSCETFDALLQAMIDLKSGGPADYFTLALHEHDPLLPTLRQRRATWYTTNLYHVCWDDGETVRSSLDTRPPYLELGSL